MNSTITKTESGSPVEILQNIVEILDRGQCVDLPHVFVGALFIFVLCAKTTYLPISIPAFLLGGYQEWSLHKLDGISTIRYSLLSILFCWFGTFVYRLARRRMMMHRLVCLLLLVKSPKLIESSLGLLII